MAAASQHACTRRSYTCVRGFLSTTHARLTAAAPTHTRFPPLPAQVTAPQLNLLEGAMARMERIAVWSMMGGSGMGANKDVFVVRMCARRCGVRWDGVLGWVDGVNRWWHC